jgi:hypothetical protein
VSGSAARPPGTDRVEKSPRTRTLPPVGQPTIPVRTYPPHLRQFERYDDALLPLLERSRDMTFDEIADRTDDPQLLNVLARWLTSAEWRGLVEQHPSVGRRPPAFVLTAAVQRAPRAA